MGIFAWIGEHLLSKAAGKLAEEGAEKETARLAEQAVKTEAERLAAEKLAAEKLAAQQVGEKGIVKIGSGGAEDAVVKIEESAIKGAKGETLYQGVNTAGEKRFLTDAEVQLVRDQIAKQTEADLARAAAEAGKQVEQQTAAEAARLTADGTAQTLKTEGAQLADDAGKGLSDAEFKNLVAKSGAGDAEKGFLSRAFSSATTKGPLRIYLGKGDLAAKLAALERVAAKGDAATAGSAKQFADLLLGKAGTSAKGLDTGELARITTAVNGESAFGKSIIEKAQKIVSERGLENTGAATFATRMANMGSFAKAHPLVATFKVAAAGGSLAYNTVKYGFKSAWWMATHKTATALLVGAGVAADEYLDDGRVVNVAKKHLVDPLVGKAEDGLKGIVNKGAQAAGLPALFNTGGSAGGGGNDPGGSNNNNSDGAGAHWYDSLKNFAGKLTGGWAILGMILNVIAWIGEHVESLAGSLFSSDTKVQTNNPQRVAGVQRQAGDDRTVQATVIDHNGDSRVPVLDRAVPTLTPT
jgi:hypothetical protein